ncbi:MAG: response regulator [Methylacidiphilales bacterium]|nr:response regulator [Candidatus Methylacidiphilales bacterium]
MKTQIKILHLEDSLMDAELITAKLRAGGLKFESIRVENRDNFLAALKKGGFDLILADRTTPTFDGISALQAARTYTPDVPFIFVSGTLEEEVAIESLKNGATDYVLKHRLSRLVPAISRALDEVIIRKKQKQLEQQLIQAQKMEGLGTLAGGIAHDFNNILTVIQFHATLLAQKGHSEAELAEVSAIIKTATERGASLVKQLMAFARKSEAVQSQVDVNTFVEDLLKMLRRTFPRNIAFEKKLAHGLPSLVSDQGQLHQALLNLCVNARDAMPNGGKLSITTGKISGKSLAARYPQAKREEYIFIEVEDNGSGMDKDTQKRIFDPFFTTKGIDKGTGLGLAVVYGIVQSHNGFIEVDSQPGRGTRFELYFPWAAKTAQVADDTEAGKPPMPGGNETILLVEDEPLLLDLVKQLLQARGYKVISAQDGVEAVETFSRHSQEIDMVLSDMGLPRQDGLRAFLDIKKIKPDVKAALCSGSLEPRIKSQMLMAGVKDFILKPFEPHQILKKVRDILDADKTGA